MNAAGTQSSVEAFPPACPNGYGGIEANLSILVAPSGQNASSQSNSLKGSYVFQFQGSIPNALLANKVVAIGSFIADGQGHIMTGVEDINSAGISRAALPILGGIYQIDGAIASIELLTPLGAQQLDMFNTIDQGAGIQSAALVNTDSIPIGSGTLTKQSGFVPQGSYVINFQGFAPAPAGLQDVLTPAALVGLIAFSPGAATAYFDFASSGIGVRKGVNAQGILNSTDGNGRFTFMLTADGFGGNPTHFAGYTFDQNHFVAISLDNYRTNYLFSGSGAR